MSFNNSNPNFDNLMLQTLMGRLGIRSPHPSLHNPPFFPHESLEELLLSNLMSDSAGSDVENDDDDDSSSSKSQLAKEESKLEKDIIRTILNGKADDTLKPNSGQAVTIGEHHICVGFHEDKDSDYRVWEWHGHIMLFDEENGYTPEYIYGNYFERVNGKKLMMEKNKSENEVDDEKKDVKEEKVTNLGLRELIKSEDTGNNRVLHRNINAASPKFTL